MLRDRGQLGFEQGHYEVSQACGERVLFPAVRGTAADDLVVAPGFSCRQPDRRLLRQPPQPAYRRVAGHSGVRHVFPWHMTLAHLPLLGLLDRRR
jgi:hypothetical protein